jgi:bacillithiol biosynthesis deacetylase BshB1
MSGTARGTRLDVLAFGAHPDDVELACGGTLALLAKQGRRVGIVHLTRGEMGTRGTPEQRCREAERAAEILGVAELEFLDCGDGHLRHGTDEEDELIELLRRFRPEVVLGPPPADRHPDHARSHRLVEAACFYAGLTRRAPERGEPHRPGAVFHYMQHHAFEPHFVVDVTEVWDTRQEAVAAYRSQVFPGTSDPEGPATGDPPTKIASEDFWRAVEGRARHFGNMVGATFGEPFGSRVPLRVRDPLDHTAVGIR